MTPIKAEGLRADFARDDQVSFLDVVATMNQVNGQVTMFMLNRDLQKERELILDWRDLSPVKVTSCQTLTGPDLKAFNTFEKPTLVAPQPLDAPKAGSRMIFKLPPRSYSVALIETS